MNIFHKVLKLWPGHESGTYGRTDRRTDGRTDVQTDGRTGRTGVTLNALPLFFEYAGHKNVCFRLQAQKQLGRVGRNINVY